MFSLFLLFLGVLMATIPLHVQRLALYISSSSYLSLSLSTQDTIRTLLSSTLVSDAGCLLIGTSACLLIPSTLGYVGAVRESTLLLVLVRLRSVTVNILLVSFSSTSHQSFYFGDWSLSSSFFSLLSSPSCIAGLPG